MYSLSFPAIAAIVLLVQPVPQQPTAIDADLLGTWVISYHPNAATRTYTVYKGGKVTYIENGEEWAGSLIPVKAGATASFALRFDRDPEDRKERITLCKDGRLLVEHFNPAAQARPDQIGIGEKK